MSCSSDEDTVLAPAVEPAASSKASAASESICLSSDDEGSRNCKTAGNDLMDEPMFQACPSDENKTDDEGEIGNEEETKNPKKTNPAGGSETRKAKQQVFGEDTFDPNRLKLLQKKLAEARKQQTAMTLDCFSGLNSKAFVSIICIPSYFSSSGAPGISLYVAPWTPRKAKRSLERKQSSGDIVMVHDSLPMATDFAETQVAPELCEDAMNRFMNETPPVADFNSPDPVLWPTETFNHSHHIPILYLKVFIQTIPNLARRVAFIL